MSYDTKYSQIKQHLVKFKSRIRNELTQRPPQDEENVLVDDVGSQDTHSILVLETSGAPSLNLTCHHLGEEEILDS